MEYYNKDLAYQIKNYMDQNEYQYQFNEEYGIFRFAFQLPKDLKSANMCISLYCDCISIKATLPICADPKDTTQMQNLAEYICRANEETMDGYLSLNFENGALSYQCFREYIEKLPSFGSINFAISIPVQMFLHYGEGLLLVMNGEKSPQKALEFCEMRLFSQKNSGNEKDAPGEENPLAMEDIQTWWMENGFPEWMDCNNPEETGFDSSEGIEADFIEEAREETMCDLSGRRTGSEEEEEPPQEKKRSLKQVLDLIKELQE